MADEPKLLQALAAITRIATSLYGPGKARKQITDANSETCFTSDAFEIMTSLSSEHAALAILREALDEQMRVYGTRCTTLLTLCNALGEAALELQRRGVPVAVTRRALASAERFCVETLKKMRLPINEAIDGFHKLDREKQLQALGEKLQTWSNSEGWDAQHDGLALPMRLAIEILKDISDNSSSPSSSLLLDGAFDVDSVLATRITLGGSSGGVSSSRVFAGALIPIDVDHCARIRHAFQATKALETCGDAVTTIPGGVVAINGDFSLPSLDRIDAFGVQLVFCHGEIDSQTMDWCWQTFPTSAHHQRIRCIAVDSHKDLAHIADLSGAQIVDSWVEILPEAIGNECIEVKLVEVSSPRLAGGLNGDDYTSEGDFRGFHMHATLFLNVVRSEQSTCSQQSRHHHYYHHHPSPLRTLLVRGSTLSEAYELQQQVKKSIRRVANALRSGYLLPSSGSYLCACTAEIRLAAASQSKPKNDHESLDDADCDSEVVVLEQIGNALSKLTVTLLQNTGQGSSSETATGSDFFALYARVRAVQANYIRGFQDDDGDKGGDSDAGEHSRFYATCHFGGSDFCALPKPKPSRLDDFGSVLSAFRKSFRLVDLALSVATYHINGSAAVVSDH